MPPRLSRLKSPMIALVTVWMVFGQFRDQQNPALASSNTETVRTAIGDDETKLQGTWVIVQIMTDNGTILDVQNGSTWRFELDRSIQESKATGSAYVTSFRLDEAKKLKEIDFTSLAGTDTIEGLYELTGDYLIITLKSAGRPTKLNDANQTTYYLRRQPPPE